MTTLTEKQLSVILKRPGYSVTEPTKRTRPAQLDSALPQGSKHEVKFIQIWGWLQGPELTRELRFCNTRRWRFDFCHKATMVAVEVQGGTRNGGRHVRHEGYKADAEKINEAQRLGWVVYQLTYDMIVIDTVKEIIDFISSRQ